MDFSKLSGDEFVEYIIKEHKNRNTKEFYETQRIRKKEDEFVTMELRKAGFKISSLFDLVNYKQTDFGYIDLLLNLFNSEKITDPIIKDGIIRAITVRKAKGIAENQLLEYYADLKTEEEKETIGWSIGNWFEHLYSDSYFEPIKAISSDKKNGISRQMFVMALGKTKKYKSDTDKLLLELTYDKEVALHAISSLGKLKSKDSIERLTELTNDKNKTIKKEANKALNKIIAE
jgi:hypothetical protein